MEIFKVENLSFAYPDQEEKALENINLTLRQGEFVLLCGRSGCGKTTLLRLLKPSLSPSGKISGSIFFEKKPLECCTPKEQAAKIGFVMQNPDNQIVTDKVFSELSFGLESLGIGQNEIRTKVSEMASFFGIESWFYKNTAELSGGQKQLLSLASVMAMQPSVLILDEPTSQLDPIAAGEFLHTLHKINREIGTTIILTEHRLEDAFPISDRVVVMDDGKIIADNTPKEVGKILKEKNHPMYKALPTPMRVYGEVSNDLPCPLTIRDGRVWLSRYMTEHTLNSDVIPKDTPRGESDAAIEVKDAYFRYEKNLPDVIKGLNLRVNKGEIFCILGGNGTGKTTALSLISGINTPYRGSVYINGESISKIPNLYGGVLAALPQNPQSVFVKKTVYLDLMEVLSEQETSEAEKKVQAVSAVCNIESLLHSHPYDLSGGQQQRAALAKILLTEPDILLLDEPTKGMDAHFKEEFADILLNLSENGVTVLMVSHDIEFCAKYAHRCALFFDGGITSADTPREFFKGKSFYTTSANRMARALLPDAVLAEDIMLACGATPKKREKPPRSINFQIKPPKKAEKQVTHTPTSDKKLTKSSLTSIFLILLLIPLTIYAGNSFFGDRKYYAVSLLIILETMIPFLMVFESRKPKARELVVISVLCAIAVAGRVAFFMLHQFKPMLPVIIIAGVCFGGETGFLVGAVSGFVSNFFFGQGPWTPWQMFSLGIIGFIAGILFKEGFLKKTRVSLCIFGFLSALIIYGGIMNSASVIMIQNVITPKMIISALSAGLPFDLIHSLGSAFFLWFISEPMIEKLERIKVKYGLIKR